MERTKGHCVCVVCKQPINVTEAVLTTSGAVHNGACLLFYGETQHSPMVENVGTVQFNEVQLLV